MCGGGECSILVLPLVARCPETIDVCIWRMLVFMFLVLLDLSSAFDTIDHDNLFCILEKYVGIRGIALKLIKSYFSNRTQRVQIDNVLSDFTNIICGVPQGSVLGPSGLLMCGGGVRSIVLMTLVTRHLETINVCIWHMFVFMSVVVTVWGCLLCSGRC